MWFIVRWLVHIYICIAFVVISSGSKSHLPISAGKLDRFLLSTFAVNLLVSVEDHNLIVLPVDRECYSELHPIFIMGANQSTPKITAQDKAILECVAISWSRAH